MKTLRRLFKFILVFFVVAVLALLAFVATFDANNYKPQIIEQVENATGRDFTIDGEINLSIFPWVGLKVEDVSLGNGEGFKAKRFAAIKQLDIKVNVLPLLKKEVEIDIIRLHGLDVSLEVAKNKSNNWSSLAQAKTAGDDAVAEEKITQAPAEVMGQEQEAGLALQSLQVEGFEFVDAVIRYDDRSSGTIATVSELNLTTSAIRFDQPIDVKFGARLENNQPVIDTRLNLTTQLSFNKELTEIDLRDFVFMLYTKANEFIKQDEQVEIKSNINVLLDDQRISLTQLQLSALGTQTLADITVSQYLTTPLIQAGIEVQSFDAREVAKRAGVDLPEMAKADALSAVALKAKIKLLGEKLQVNDLSLSLDGNTLSGWLHVLNISQQQLRYDLVFDQLNINDYLPPVAASAEDQPVGAVEKSEVNVTAEADVESGDEKIELPLEMIRQLDVQGDFRITSLTAREYQIKQFLMSLKAANGALVIEPLSMQLLQGQVAAVVKMNVQQAVPTYEIKLDVNQVQAGPVVNPLLDGLMGDKPLSMEGAINVDMDVSTTGESLNQLKQASKGQIVLDMKETAVNGFDPEYYMRSSVADYVHEKGFGLSNTIMGSYKPREVTVFDKIHSTVNLAKGKASTNDFLMDSKRVQVRAEGIADIMKNTLDVTTSVKLPRAKTAVEKIFDEPVYVRVHGPFDALQYELDKNRLKASTIDVLKNQAKAKVDAEKQRLIDEAKAKVDAEKQRLKEKMDEEKRRAEEKAKQELKKSTDKYQDKLKDKLKGLF